MTQNSFKTKLAAGLAVPYFALWAWAAWDGYREQQAYLELYAAQRNAGNSEMATSLLQQAQLSQEQVHNAWVWGIAIPALAYAAWAIGTRLYRSYFPQR